jgi:hypothetical protein
VISRATLEGLMPLYFLDVSNTDISARDPEGHQLPDLEAACRAAIASIRSILAHEVAEGRLDLRGQIRIEDERGEVVRVVPYSEALEIKI